MSTSTMSSKGQRRARPTRTGERALDWHERVSARAGVQAALAMPNPVMETIEAAGRSMRSV